MPDVTLITGGARSGKSRLALELAEAYENKTFVATAQVCDDEMAERIRRHQEDRDNSFLTVEEPLHLARALREIPPGQQVVVVDCLTVWLGNVMHRHGFEQSRYREVDEFLDTLVQDRSFAVVLVANELGMGLVPDNALGRRFRDVAGELNQAVARLADRMFFVVSGLPLSLKGEQL
jgi:adenosylcobinamide kinase/adenosylcobinamide-phosphate guanylyltransferase